MALIATRKEDFNAGAPSGFSSFGTGAAYANKMVEIQSQLSATYSGVNTGATNYDLTGSSVFTQYVGHDAGATSITSFEAYPINLANFTGTDGYLWQVLPPSGLINAYKKVASVNTNIYSGSYNPNLHRYFRIRESGGTTYFDTSADGILWTNRGSTANIAVITALYFGFLQGTWQAEGTQAKCYFDNLNIQPQPNFMLGNNF